MHNLLPFDLVNNHPSYLSLQDECIERQKTYLSCTGIYDAIYFKTSLLINNLGNITSIVRDMRDINASCKGPKIKKAIQV